MTHLCSPEVTRTRFAISWLDLKRDWGRRSSRRPKAGGGSAASTRVPASPAPALWEASPWGEGRQPQGAHAQTPAHRGLCSAMTARTNPDAASARYRRKIRRTWSVAIAGRPWRAPRRYLRRRLNCHREHRRRSRFVKPESRWMLLGWSDRPASRCQRPSGWVILGEQPRVTSGERRSNQVEIYF